MHVRDGAKADFPAIQRIARRSFDRVYAFFAVRGRRHAWPLLVAEEDGAVAAFLEGRVFDGPPPLGYVYFVAVDPDHRRKHVGRILVEESLRRFGARGATRVFAAVPADNGASMALFKALGFTEVPQGAMRAWYGRPSVLLLMRMMIAPHEILLAHTFADLPPTSVDGPSRP